MAVPLVKTQSLVKGFSVKGKGPFGFGHGTFEVTMDICVESS